MNSIDRISKERVSFRLPAKLVAEMDAHIASHPWKTRGSVIGEAIDALTQTHTGGPLHG